MTHPQIRWVKDVQEPARTFRRMVVGWQNVLASLNATVLGFNSAYLKDAAQQAADPNHGMKEIAVKKLVIASLREIKPQIDAWYGELHCRGVVSPATADEKRNLRHLLAQVD